MFEAGHISIKCCLKEENIEKIYGRLHSSNLNHIHRVGGNNYRQSEVKTQFIHSELVHFENLKQQTEQLVASRRDRGLDNGSNAAH